MFFSSSSSSQWSNSSSDIFSKFTAPVWTKCSRLQDASLALELPPPHLPPPAIVKIDSNQIFIVSIQASMWGLCSCKTTTSLQLKLVRFHRDLKRCHREEGLCLGEGLLSGGDQLWSEDRGSQDFAIHRYLFYFFKYLKWLVSVRLDAKVSN